MSKSARRHYRVAQKEQAYNPARGTFIPKKRQPKLVAAIICAAVMVFINGVITGWLLGKKK